MNRIFEKISKLDFAAIVCFCGIFAYNLYLAVYDGTISDEAFYLTIPYRILNGDGIFTDEWHLSALSGVLTLFPVKLFMMITGGTEGIILFFRLLFVLMQTAVGIYIYISLKKEGLAALFFSMSFMIFAVIGMGTLSYNTMGLCFLVLICVLLYKSKEKPKALYMILSGTFIACFILCQPLGVAFYAIYFFTVLIVNIIFKKSKEKIPFTLNIKSCAFTVAGILPVLIFFLFVFFKNSDLETVLKCIPGILSDPEHMVIGENIGIETFSIGAFFSDLTMAAGIVPLIIFVILGVLGVLLNKVSRPVGVLLLTLGVAQMSVCTYLNIFTGCFGDTTNDINFFFFPPALSGLFLFLLCKKKNYRAFILFWCPGILYAVMMTVSSNLRLNASINGYFLSSLASMIFINDLIKELNEEEETKILRIFKKIFICAFFSLLIFNTGNAVFNNVITRVQSTSTTVPYGIYKGMKLPSDQALTHVHIYKDVLQIKEKTDPNSKIFVLENVPGAYLDGQFEMGIFSGWFIADELNAPEVINRFFMYYEIFPENIPDYIYAPNYFYSEYGLKYANAKTYIDLASNVFNYETEKLENGLLLKVTGLNNQ